MQNDLHAYALNNITPQRDPDGSVTVQFGGCFGQQANCLPIFPGWKYMNSLCQPRPEILNGRWSFPGAKLAQDA